MESAEYLRSAFIYDLELYKGCIDSLVACSISGIHYKLSKGDLQQYIVSYMVST